MNTQARKPKVLIVEDEEDLREILQFEIEEANFDALAVKNGMEALEVLKVEEIDVVLSDLCMPEMSGTLLLKNLRASGFYKPFIVVSGYGTRTEAIELLRLGAMDFIEKPFDPAKLRSSIVEAVRLSRALPILKEALTKLGDKVEGEEAEMQLGKTTLAHAR